MHSPAAVWVAVMTGVPLIRSTGHGRSVVFDAAGRLVAMASSFNGPVALVAGPRQLVIYSDFYSVYTSAGKKADGLVNLFAGLISGGTSSGPGTRTRTS